MPTESCDLCGFESDDYTHQDLLGTLRGLGTIWRWMVDGTDSNVLAQRPGPEVWSALEYVAHSRDVIGAMGYAAHLARTSDSPAVAPPGETPEPDCPPTIGEAIDGLEANAQRLHAKAVKFDAATWQRSLVIGDDEVDVEWMVAHAVHDATHHLKDVGRGLHSLGAGVPSQRGTVEQVNASDGGVPKSPLPSADIGRRGVIGDRQAERQHHGKPMQAISVWSQEVIDALRAEGHPIRAGAAGENITVAGIDWASLRPGARILLGDALVEISAYATPCKKNAQWFADRDFTRIDHGKNPGWSRAYAWVLEGGTVRPGDPVVVEP